MAASPAKRLHIGVIGAGTAGLATAIAFARAGHTVDVFEKHPALATLGAGVLMQPQGVAALDELGVGAAFNAISLPIDRLVGQCERGWTLVDIPYTGLQARAVSRSALGGVLERESHALACACTSAAPWAPSASKTALVQSMQVACCTASTLS